MAATSQQPELFVSGESFALVKGGFLHLTIPSGGSVQCFALTRYAAMRLQAMLAREIPMFAAAPDGDLIRFPKRRKGGRKHA